MKIAVIGHSGAGKSTLARRLGREYGCPVLHLDKIQFEPGWEERDRAEARRLVQEFMDREKSWIIEGNYSGFWQERRLAEADWILYFNFSRWRCLYQAARRFFRYYGTVREDMADGCIEKMDLEFLVWILWKGRTKKQLYHFRKVLETYPEKAVELKRRRDVDRWLERQREDRKTVRDGGAGRDENKL